MKPIYSVIVFLFILCCASVSTVHGYRCAKENIIADMNQALVQTLQEKQEGWITPDTISVYRSHLKIAALRNDSFVYYADATPSRALCSKPMIWKRHERQLVFQGYSTGSMAAVLAISDQRLSLLLAAMALLWGIGSLTYFRNYRKGVIILGNLVYEQAQDRFTDRHRQTVAFTPMQHRLMQLFFTADDHRLSKQQICDTLWPKKPDASETLYTLIRRLKRILEEVGGLSITSERGKDYRLHIRQ